MFVAFAIHLSVVFTSRDVEVMGLLEGADDREKLEVWMLIGWLWRNDKFVEGIEQVALKLLLRRPSALLEFEEKSNSDGHASPCVFLFIPPSAHPS